jgi:hypothetical protein
MHLWSSGEKRCVNKELPHRVMCAVMGEGRAEKQERHPKGDNTEAKPRSGSLGKNSIVQPLPLSPKGLVTLREFCQPLWS